MSFAPDDPTEVLDEDDGEPTRSLDEPGTAETDILLPSMATGSPEEMRTRRIAEEGPPVPPEVGSGRNTNGDSRKRGIWMLAASIAASLILVGVYIAAGGLDYKPAGAADPCDARAWTDPGNLEESVQQFALSAVDGAACELHVSREELIRALADDDSRAAFAEEKGLSDSEIEDAIRSGLNRAIDDAENADAISPLVATGLRVAARVMPVDQMIPLIQDASDIFSGGDLDGLGGVIDGLSDDSGSSGDSVPEDLTQSLRDQLPDEIERNIPKSVDERIQKELNGLLNP